MPKLLEDVRNLIRTLNDSYRTEETYLKEDSAIRETLKSRLLAREPPFEFNRYINLDAMLTCGYGLYPRKIPVLFVVRCEK